MIADISINQLKLISKATSALLRWESPKVVEYYYINQGPIIFRTLLKIDDSVKFDSFLQQLSMPTSIPIQKPLRDNSGEILDEIKRLKQTIENAERRKV